MTPRGGPTVVLLPVRSFAEGNSRLRGALAPEERRDMGRRCATAVRRAAADLPTVVMTDDQEVADWAVSTGADTIRDEGRDLNSSLVAAVGTLRRRGVRRVIVAHADLPLADDLTWIDRHHGVLVVPDRRNDGTNVLAVPTGVQFRFAYGPASNMHHETEGRRLGLEVTIVPDPLLGWDVDHPEDLRLPEGRGLARLRETSRRVRNRVATASDDAPVRPTRPDVA